MRRFPELGHNSAPEAGIVISPYAKQGYIDHQTLSFDAYTKFIEDDFLAGQRLDPATDGRPYFRLRFQLAAATADDAPGLLIHRSDPGAEVLSRSVRAPGTTLTPAPRWKA